MKGIFCYESNEKYLHELLESKTSDEYEILIFAVIKGYVNVVKHLLTNHKITKIGDDLINSCVKSGHYQITKLFLEDDRLKITNIKITLEHAIEKNYHSIIKLLLPYTTKYISEKHTLFRYPSTTNESLIPLLQNPKINIVPTDNIIQESVNSGNEHIILKLITYPSTIDKNILFINSIRRNLTSVIYNLLADPDVNPGYNKSSSIITAVESDNYFLVKLLSKDHRINSFTSKSYPIRIAIKYNYHTIFNYLITLYNKKDSKTTYIINFLTNYNLSTITKLLESNKISITCYYSFSFYSAYNFKYIKLVLFLLNDHRIKPSDHNNFFMKLAIFHRDVKLLKIVVNSPSYDPYINSSIWLGMYQKIDNSMLKVFLTDPKLNLLKNVSLLVKILHKFPSSVRYIFSKYHNEIYSYPALFLLIKSLYFHNEI